MLPILLIHGYSSEGASNTVDQIYGTLPADLRQAFGPDAVLELNLSRWISLSDGIALDDVSFAMDRALKSEFGSLLSGGFHVVIHSTGALVVRNWIKLFSPKPCPIVNLVHLAGANFGSGLAHIGRGQLARWTRALQGTGRGVKVLNELEFGAWKTIDLHRHFLEEGCDMYRDYQVQEFCIIGSQTLKALRHIPIRYVKEDSSDNTVRTSAGNLNFNYIAVFPKEDSLAIDKSQLRSLIDQRLDGEHLESEAYDFDLSGIAESRPAVPYAIAFETAHFGEDIGIVTGSQNRKAVVPLVCEALRTPYDESEYGEKAIRFESERVKTFKSASKLKGSLLEWDKRKQYEGHAQLVFRLRDQFGVGVRHFDVTLNSQGGGRSRQRLEAMIEDKHLNKQHPGTITFYLRTQSFDADSGEWVELLDSVATLQLEITAHEADTDELDFVPLRLRLTPTQVRKMIQSFRTTIVDITMLRLPSEKVFSIQKG